MRRQLIRLVIVTMTIVGGFFAAPAAPAAASPLDNCWVTAYQPWISGNTITFSASSFCSPNTAIHQFAVERYRNGQYHGHINIRCQGTNYCHGETTQQDIGGNQEWCTVIEGTVYIVGVGGRFLSEKRCETASW
jgi:hypothetical protein